MKLTLRSLQHFVVLAEERHYSRAAQRLHLTQPALSRSIQGLEDGLGLELLDRTGRGLVLTQAGKQVLQRAHRILGEATELLREAERIRGHDTGRIAFGMGAFPAATFLSPLLSRLAREHPGLAIHVEVESWQLLLEKLQQDKLDFAIAVTHSLPPPPEFTVRPLPPQHGGLFVRAGHPLLALRGSALRAALADYGLAATNLPPRARDYLARLYRLTRPDDLPITLECDNIPTLRDVTLASDVVLFCTREALAAELAAGSLGLLALSYPPIGVLRYAVIHHARRTLPPAAERVIDGVRQLLAAPPGITTTPDSQAAEALPPVASDASLAAAESITAVRRSRRRATPGR